MSDVIKTFVFEDISNLDYVGNINVFNNGIIQIGNININLQNCGIHGILSVANGLFLGLNVILDNYGINNVFFGVKSVSF